MFRAQAAGMEKCNKKLEELNACKTLATAKADAGTASDSD
jgi:hypothetical protein